MKKKVYEKQLRQLKSSSNTSELTKELAGVGKKAKAKKHKSVKQDNVKTKPNQASSTKEKAEKPTRDLPLPPPLKSKVCGPLPKVEVLMKRRVPISDVKTVSDELEKPTQEAQVVTVQLQQVENDAKQLDRRNSSAAVSSDDTNSKTSAPCGGHSFETDIDRSNQITADEKPSLPFKEVSQPYRVDLNAGVDSGISKNNSEAGMCSSTRYTLLANVPPLVPSTVAENNPGIRSTELPANEDVPRYTISMPPASSIHVSQPYVSTNMPGPMDISVSNPLPNASMSLPAAPVSLVSAPHPLHFDRYAGSTDSSNHYSANLGEFPSAHQGNMTHRIQDYHTLTPMTFPTDRPDYYNSNGQPALVEPTWEQENNRFSDYASWRLHSHEGLYSVGGDNYPQSRAYSNTHDTTTNNLSSTMAGINNSNLHDNNKHSNIRQHNQQHQHLQTNTELEGKRNSEAHTNGYTSEESQSVKTSVGSGRRRRKRVQTPVQRSAANMRERRRMCHLNVAFDYLKEHLPNVKDKKKLSRIQTLKAAIYYINLLRDSLKMN